MIYSIWNSTTGVIPMSKYIPFDEVKTAISMERAIKMLDLDVRRSGNQYRGACPIHGGGDRGLAITPKEGDWGKFFCHASGSGGSDCIALAAHVLECRMNEAAHHLFTVPEAREEQPPERREHSSLEKVRDRLQHDHADVQAMGLAPETARDLGVGFDSRGMMRGRVCVPLYKSGELVGFMGLVDADVKLPPNLSTPTNVVRMKKRA
jgi:hypothetical protein